VIVFGILTQINQLKPGPEPPFELDVENLKIVRWKEGWAVLWVLAAGVYEFATGTAWAQGASHQVTRKHILSKGFQSGEILIVCFELDEDEEEPLDMNALVERYDWHTGVEIP